MDFTTANSPKHNYSHPFKRYLKTRSTRSVEAIMRTKRLDAGFFWMEFSPLVRDIFLAKHPDISEKELDVLFQLHANQPFTVSDINFSTLKPKSFFDFTRKTSLGERTVIKFLKKFIDMGVFRVFKMNGRYNKKLYEFTPDWNNEFKRMYEQMLCITKIRYNETRFVPSQVRKSKAHFKKILKQNAYKDKFDQELKREVQTSNKEFAVKLHDVRAQSRML